jgi:hypothetical protein
MTPVRWSTTTAMSTVAITTTRAIGGRLRRWSGRGVVLRESGHGSSQVTSRRTAAIAPAMFAAAAYATSSSAPSAGTTRSEAICA